jgi:predicted permease
MNQSIYQLKQAWAGLILKKGFLATVVTTLGITIGALLCVLTLAYVVISKPLPYSEQDHLYQLNTLSFNSKEDLVARAHYYPSLVHLFDNQTLFAKSALMHYGQGVITSQPTQPQIISTAVTPGWFELLDSEVAMGRVFEQTEVKDSYNPVTILSYETWQKEFNGTEEILEQNITINGISFRVIGVLSERFVEPQLLRTGVKTDVFLPWDYNSLASERRLLWGRIDGGLRFIGKIDSEMSPTQVEQELGALVHNTWTENVADNPAFKGDVIKVELKTLKEVITRNSKNTVLLLLIGVFGLLLVACANITNLFMSRQLAIQAALGASKNKLYRALFAQSGLVIFISVIVALVIASLGFEVLQVYMISRLPRVDELTINGATLGSAVIIALVLALFFARLGANMITYRSLNSTLQSSGKGIGVQVSKKVRKVLIISQVTIVTLLVFINISLLKDSLKVINQPLGFETDNISTLTLSINASGGLSEEEKKSLMSELKSKLMALPQVEDVANATSPLFDRRIIIQEINSTGERLNLRTKTVDERYFQMIGQPLIEGDFFSESDVRDESKLLIINDVYAAKIAPQGSALGSKVTAFRQQQFTVSGIVKGVKMPAENDIPMRAFTVPLYEWPRFMIKLKPEQLLSRELIANTVREANSRLTLLSFETLNDRKGRLLFTQYTTATTSGILAVLTFFLATIGLYGILNYVIQVRRFELGTRLAIGAKRMDIIGLLLKDNIGTVSIGFTFGVTILLVLSISFSDIFSSYINQQFVTQLFITLILICIMTLFASYWPLRSIINSPVIRSLRGEE